MEDFVTYYLIAGFAYSIVYLGYYCRGLSRLPLEEDTKEWLRNNAAEMSIMSLFIVSAVHSFGMFVIIVITTLFNGAIWPYSLFKLLRVTSETEEENV